MKIYDIHSHLGKTSSGDENTPEELLQDLNAYGISKVGLAVCQVHLQGYRMTWC